MIHFFLLQQYFSEIIRHPITDITRSFFAKNNETSHLSVGRV